MVLPPTTAGDAMASVRKHTWISSSADDVWAVVRDHGAISEWFPGIDESSAIADNRRSCVVDGNVIEEDMVTNDDELRRLQYVVSAGFPVEHHLATVDVIDNGDDCLVIYSTDVKPDEAREAVGPALEGGLEGLKAACESS